MLKTQQLVVEAGAEGLTPADQCQARAAASPHRQGQLTSHRLHTKIGDRTRDARQMRTVIPAGGAVRLSAEQLKAPRLA